MRFTLLQPSKRTYCHRKELVRVNVGCGLDIVPGYENLDNSPSLLIQRNPVLRGVAALVEQVLQRPMYTRFPSGVRRWDVTTGLPYPDESVEVICSSHMLEHLPRDAAECFLREAYRVLKWGGITRLALPDLEGKAREYLIMVEKARGGKLPNELPADWFMRTTLLGIQAKASFLKPRSFYRVLLGREGHFWMWDAPSLIALLRQIGFREVRECGFRESYIPEVEFLDLESRKDESFYVEARK